MPPPFVHLQENGKRKKHSTPTVSGQPEKVAKLDSGQIRRSSRHRKQRGEKEITVSSVDTLRDLKIKVTCLEWLQNGSWWLSVVCIHACMRACVCACLHMHVCACVSLKRQLFWFCAPSCSVKVKMFCMELCSLLIMHGGDGVGGGSLANVIVLVSCRLSSLVPDSSSDNEVVLSGTL